MWLHVVTCGIEAILEGFGNPKQSSYFTQQSHITYIDSNYVSIYRNIHTISGPFQPHYFHLISHKDKTLNEAYSLFLKFLMIHSIVFVVITMP